MNTKSKMSTTSNGKEVAAILSGNEDVAAPVLPTIEAQECEALQWPLPVRRRYSKKTTGVPKVDGNAAPEPAEDVAAPELEDACEKAVLSNKLRMESASEAEKLRPEIAELVEQVRNGCGEALKSGLGTTGSSAALPLLKAARLAETAREATLATWAWTTCGKGQAPMHHLQLPPLAKPFAELALGLADTFVQLGKLEVPTEIKDCNATTSRQLDNLEVGLHLAAVHLDAVAACGPLLPPASRSSDDEDPDRPVLNFLSHVIRAVFGAKGGAPVGAAAPRFAAAMGMMWRAAHRAMAAAKYAETPITRRLLPLAARCITNLPQQGSLPSTLATLASNAAYLLVAAVGQGEAALQELAAEELAGGSAPLTSSRVSSHTSGSSDRPALENGAEAPRARGRQRRQNQGPGPHTAALVRAVSASCLPMGLGDSLLARETIANEASTRLEHAESRAAAFVKRILQRSLLAVSDRESEGWLRLEALTRELLDTCGDPFFPAAPLLLLCLARGLARVAGAPRTVEMTWTQREFAVRLLGTIATGLCRECSAAAKYTSGAKDLQELAAWVAGGPKGSKRGQVAARGSSHRMTSEKADTDLDELELAKEFPRLLTEFLEASPQGTELVALAPDTEEATLPTNVGKPVSGDVQKPVLEAAVLSAEHPVYASAFILCSWAAPRAPLGQNPAEKNAKAKKRRSNKDKVVSVSTVDAEGDAADSPWWALNTWAKRAFVLDPRLDNRKSTKSRDAVAQCVLRLYKNNVHTDLGALSRTRMVALEVLLRQLKSSPLVFVRRQAVSGLAAACCADRRLATSPNTGEALTRALRDESALVRSAAIDFVGRLVSGRAEGLEPQYASELRAAARAGLADAAPGVRRAAFRVVCDALCREDPALMASVSELLRRIRFETPQVRDPVLTALERVLLAPPLPETILDHLTAVVSDPDIGGPGLRDLFTTHRGAHGQGVFEDTMMKIATGALQVVDSCKAIEDALPAASVLVQVGVEHPAALYEHMQSLQSWLTISANASSGGMDLAQHACRILSDILPSWASQAPSPVKQKVGRTIQEALTLLLEAPRNLLTRGAMECLCVVAMSVTTRSQDVLEHVNSSLQYLRDTVERGAPLDGLAQASLCRHAWMLSTAHEFVDVDAICSEIKSSQPELATAQGTAPLVARLLSAMCLKGPLVLRPLLMPCLGFLTRRHTHLMQTQLGPRDVFKAGLSSGGGLQACSVEVLADLLSSYQRAAEAGAPSGGVQDEAGGAARALRAPKVAEAVQRVGELQPAVLPLLSGGATRAVTVASHALSVVRSLSTMGVLHPSPAFSALVASSLAGFESLTPDTSRLMLKLVESGPQLLISRLGAGIRQAAALVKAGNAEAGSFFSNSWRFSTLSELCSEHFESKRMRENFLDALLAEVELMGSAAVPSQEGCLLERMELLFGLFTSLPYRNEFELAYILRRSSQFLTLRAIPLLPDNEHSVTPAEGDDVLGVCCASVLLHSVCGLLCSPSEIQRLLTADQNGEADKALQPGFARRLTADETIQPLFRQIAAAAGNSEALVEIVAQNVPVDSPLLKGLGLRALAQKQEGKGRRRKSSGEHESMPKQKMRRTSGGHDKENTLNNKTALGEAAAFCGA